MVINFSRFKLAKQGVFKNLPNPNNSDDIYLWRSVIDQALHDLGADQVYVREEAEEWFDVLNEDFIETCDLAEVDPLSVLQFYSENYTVLTNTDFTQKKRRRNAKPIHD